MRSTSIFVALLLLAQAGLAAAAEEGQIEEIVVTGSYIKKDSFDSSSPIKVIDQVELQNESTPALGEVLANQTFNYGSDVFSNNYTARFQEGNATAANLRGLGSRATLNLIDGKRGASNKPKKIVPQISVERIDILKDGASALYGSDAVAGVVNVMTRNDYEGFEVGGFFTGDADGDHDEYVLNAILGTQTDRGHIVFAGEYRKRTVLQQLDRPEFLEGGFSRSGTGNPGSWIVPTRDATGAIDGSTQLRDPGCGVVVSPGGDGNAAAGTPFNNISGTPAGPSLCRFQFGEFFNFVNPNETFSLWSNFEHAFTDTIVYELSVIHSRQETSDRGSPTNPGGRIGDLDPILGTHPGNPYRAMAPDVNGDMQPIFAQVGPDGTPLRGVDGQVILAPDPFVNSAGTISFNEDVTPAALRLFGKLGTLPSTLDDTGANIGAGKFDSYNTRVANKLSFDIGDSSWQGETNVVYQRTHSLVFQKNQSFPAVQAGLQGNLADVDGDGEREWYNPFSTSGLTCVDRVCTDTGRQFDNKQQVADVISFIGNTTTNVDYWQIDLIFTGDLFELGGNTVAGAFGWEWQDTKLDFDDTVNDNGCTNWINRCGFDYKARQKVNSLFGELLIPIGDTAEVQLAARYSDYGALGDSIDPKIAGLWQPAEWLSLRASYSTAFIVPTLGQLFAAETSFLQTTNDPVFGDNEGSFRTNSYTGNQDLLPEEADVYNIGFSMNFFDGSLGLGLDYAQYDFTDRISRTTAPQVVEADYAAFLQAYPQADPANPDPADSEAWVLGTDPSRVQDPAISRGQGPSYTILEVKTEWLNAQTMDHKAWDMYVSYNLPTDSAGMWNFRVDATYVDSYEYDLGNGTSGDGVGRQNDTIDEIPPTPEWRVVGTVNWSLGGHFALARLRWSDSVLFDSAGFTPATCRSATPADTCQELEDMLYLDLTYSYTFDSLFGEGRRTVIEVGGRNVTDELPEPIFNLSGIETFLHDPRGATYFLRFQQEI